MTTDSTNSVDGTTGATTESDAETTTFAAADTDSNAGQDEHARAEQTGTEQPTTEQAAAPLERAAPEQTTAEQATAEHPATEQDTAVDEPAAAAGPAAGSASAPKQGFLAGAAAIVSAGVGLVSLIGSPVSEMLRTHAQLNGQISAQTGGATNQIDILYSTPWHTAALVNGFLALVAVLIGCAALSAALRPAGRHWVRAVALGGAVLGVLGVLMAGGMYFDLFATPPELPTMPPGGGMMR